MTQRLSVYACRVTRHPSNVQFESGPRVSILVSVYGEVNPDDPETLLIYEEPILVDFLVGPNSELLKSGITKGTTLYVPASFITKEPNRRKDGTPVLTKDGKGIHRFMGMSIGDILVKDQPAAMAPTIKTVAKSQVLSAEAQSGFLGMVKALFGKHA